MMIHYKFIISTMVINYKKQFYWIKYNNKKSITNYYLKLNKNIQINKKIKIKFKFKFKIQPFRMFIQQYFKKI